MRTSVSSADDGSADTYLARSSWTWETSEPTDMTVEASDDACAASVVRRALIFCAAAASFVSAAAAAAPMVSVVYEPVAARHCPRPGTVYTLIPVMACRARASHSRVAASTCPAYTWIVVPRSRTAQTTSSARVTSRAAALRASRRSGDMSSSSARYPASAMVHCDCSCEAAVRIAEPADVNAAVCTLGHTTPPRCAARWGHQEGFAPAGPATEGTIPDGHELTPRPAPPGAPPAPSRFDAASEAASLFDAASTRRAKFWKAGVSMPATARTSSATPPSADDIGTPAGPGPIVPLNPNASELSVETIDAMLVPAE